MMAKTFTMRLCRRETTHTCLDMNKADKNMPKSPLPPWAVAHALTAAKINVKK